MGCPAKGKSGLGIFNDNGRNLVPVNPNIPTETMDIKPLIQIDMRNHVFNPKKITKNIPRES